MAVKSERVNLVTTPAQRAVWEKCAEAEGVTLSEWVRRCAEREVGAILLTTARRVGAADLIAAGR